MKLFVTGFGPFLDVEDNPSATLAAKLGQPYAILDVSFSAVQSFVQSNELDHFEALLHLGVSNRPYVSLETTARNAIGIVPDVRGELWGPGAINPNVGGHLNATLFDGVLLPHEARDVQWSVDAGDYLCNFLLFESIRTRPNMRIGFIHVASFSLMPEDAQLAAIQGILSQIQKAESRNLSKLA